MTEKNGDWELEDASDINKPIVKIEDSFSHNQILTEVTTSIYVLHLLCRSISFPIKVICINLCIDVCLTHM
jgi:hypothetical protein